MTTNFARKQVPLWVAGLFGALAVFAFAVALYYALAGTQVAPVSFAGETARPSMATGMDSHADDVSVIPASQSAAGKNQQLIAVPADELQSGWYAVRVSEPQSEGPIEASRFVPFGVDTPPLLMGSKKATHYHLMNCEWADRIPEENKIFFMGAQYAVEAGYAPCEDCLPPLQ